MKQRKVSIISMLLLVVSTLMMTSCDEEQETAMMLWGTWEGQLSTEFYQDRWGSSYGESYYTVWHFEGNPGSRQGNGWEIDYVRGRRYAQRFRWQVMDGGNTVRLVYDSWDEQYIYNFYLSGDYFTGQIEDAYGQLTGFRLYKVDDNGYEYDYGWDNYAKKPIVNGKGKE